MSTYQEVVDWLFDQVPNYQHQGGSAYKPGLERITELAKVVGNPHQKLKTIHVAGTNGKGSVSHIIANAFAFHGYKTGLFTSPHIKDFRERIKINGNYISEAFVVDFVTRYREDFIRIQPSFFEITTAMALKAFVDVSCDIAIIETGLGGRLDSTNIIVPELSIITNIGMDHTAFLGNTLEAIAGEKAGIIKKNKPVVIGDVNPALKGIFQKRAEELGSVIIFSQNEPQSSYQTDLLGEYQQRNLQTAKIALNQLKSAWNLEEDKIVKSFLNIREGVNFVGRMQKIADHPLTIVDAAHNIEGITSLVNGLHSFKYQTLYIIYGASNDKDWKEIMQIFPSTSSLHLAQFDSKRSVSTTEFKEERSKSKRAAKIHESPLEALNYCKTVAHEDDLILICGSFYLIEKIL